MKDYRGPITGYYTDMFGQDYPYYGESKIYLVTNVGQKREEILAYLKEKDILILRPLSIFKTIEIVIEGDFAVIEAELRTKFNCGLWWDND